MISLLARTLPVADVLAGAYRGVSLFVVVAQEGGYQSGLRTNYVVCQLVWFPLLGQLEVEDMYRIVMSSFVMEWSELCSC